MSEADARITDAEAERLRTVAAYQFGAGAGAALFVGDEVVHRTGSGRPQQVLTERGGERVVSFGTDGRFTLGAGGGRRLRTALDPPACRVAVNEESVPFVTAGKNAFAKFVGGVAPDVRPGDEVLVVHGGPTVGQGVDLSGNDDRARAPGGETDEELLAVGRAELPAAGMADFETGVAVKVREGVPAPES
jgi:uncharacterized protein with predicted RNA binding PUA domain